MADILIKNYEMPKSCITGKIPDYEYCPFFGSCPKASAKEERPSDCPLVELPEHGDLIDRNELLKFDNITYIDTGYWVTDYEAVKISVIKSARVIVEATDG